MVITTMTNSDFLRSVYGEFTRGEYSWVCTFPGDPGNAKPFDWAGRPYMGGPAQATIINRTADQNTYYCPAILNLVDGEQVRRKSAFVSLAALVVDDVNPSDLVNYSYALETSPGNFQVGILLDQADPDVSNLDLIDSLMAHLSGRGWIKNDRSGNNSVRLVRMPGGMNHKPREAGPWEVKLHHWDPTIRYSLDDAAAAMHVNLDTLRMLSAKSPEPRQLVTGSHGGEFMAAITGPLDERSYHDNLRDLAASLIAGGMFPGAAVNYLYSVMDQAKPAGPESEILRWQARRAEIPRAVKSAEKFAPPERAPVSVTVNLHKDEPEGQADAGEIAPLDWMALAGKEPEQIVWAVEGWLPRGHVTMLSANGGVGKSTAALQLAVAVCQGVPWLGLATAQGSVLVISAEDGTSLIHLRVANICQAHGVSLQSLHRDLVVYDLSEQDSVLWRDGAPTARMQWLADAVHQHQPSVVVLDNASDLYADNENDRSAVRGFLRCLKQIAAANEAAILTLAHVDKASVRSGAGLDTDSTFSGSTAWNNTARSRWAMVISDGREILLKHEKCNVGPKSAPVSIEYDATAHIFREYGTVPGAAAAAALLRNSNQVAIIRALDQAVAAGQRLSMSATSNNNAFRALQKAPGFPRIVRGDFFALLFQMQRDGLIEELEYVGQSRHKHKYLAVTDAGRMRAAYQESARAA